MEPSSSTNSAPKRPWFSEQRTRIGILGSSVWLVFWLPFSLCDFSKLSCFWPLAPNEWGDWAAGAFAPLAFLWLILGYLQQGEELKQNTNALRLQEKQLQAQVVELQSAARAQRELVKATREQVDASAQASLVAATSTALTYQPVLHPLIDYEADSNKYTVSIRNKGFEITDAKLSIDSILPNDIKVDLRAKPMQIFPSEGTWYVAFHSTDDRQFSITFLCEYTDGLGIAQKQKLEARVNNITKHCVISRLPRGSVELPRPAFSGVRRF